MSNKFPKYLGIIDCNTSTTIDYWEELARKNEVEIIPILTEYAFMVFAPKGSRLKAWTNHRPLIANVKDK